MRKVASANAHAIFAGDPVVSLVSGYVDIATPGSGIQVAGICNGFSWLSKSMGNRVWNNYWPGTGDANGDIDIYVIDDPAALFSVQAGPVAIALADTGKNADFVAGSGNTLTQQSTAYLGTSAATATLPFRIVGTINDAANDTTSGYDRVLVAFNFQDFKSTTGI